MKVSEVADGQGMAGEIGGHKVAVYNKGGELTVLRNICTHMSCQTDWNPDESTWDCPCHGSRYNADGSLLRGPANAPLAAVAFHVDGDEIVID